MIAVIDYGMGNLGSILSMLRKIGSEAFISSDPKEIASADRIILPGVGSFDTGMHQLKEKGLIDILNKKALVEKVPFLGICLGAQLMTQSSDEGVLAGLGWFSARTLKFNFSGLQGKFPLPNIGWNIVKNRGDTNLLQNMDEDARFYFVHTFYLHSEEPSQVSMTAEYGFEYTVGLERSNILGVQFHPEKSHKFGMQLLTNFLKYY